MEEILMMMMGKGRRCVKEGTEEWNMMMGMIL